MSRSIRRLASARWRITMVSCFGAIAAGVIVLFVWPFGRISVDGDATIRLDELGRGASIVQAFDVASDGLRTVRLRLSASRPAPLRLVYRITLTKGAATLANIERQQQFQLAGGAQWIALEFPALSRSAGTQAVLTIENATPPQDAGGEVALMAVKGRLLPNGYLTVAGEERWAALQMVAHSDGDTLFGAFRLGPLSRVPERLRQPWLVVAALALYVVLLFPTIGALLPNGDTRPAPLPDATPAAGRWAAALGVMLLGSLAVIGWLIYADRGEVPLIEALDQADVHSTGPLHQFVNVVQVDIGLESRRAIFAHASTSLGWVVTPSASGRLETAIALGPNTWDRAGDGVVFRVSVREGDRVRELFTRRVHPQDEPSDRRWIPVEVDLSSFAGRPVELLLTTEPSPAGMPPDSTFDWAVWGEPLVRGAGLPPG